MYTIPDWVVDGPLKKWGPHCCSSPWHGFAEWCWRRFPGKKALLLTWQSGNRPKKCKSNWGNERGIKLRSPRGTGARPFALVLLAGSHVEELAVVPSCALVVQVLHTCLWCEHLLVKANLNISIYDVKRVEYPEGPLFHLSLPVCEDCCSTMQTWTSRFIIEPMECKRKVRLYPVVNSLQPYWADAEGRVWAGTSRQVWVAGSKAWWRNLHFSPYVQRPLTKPRQTSLRCRCAAHPP